MSHAFHFQIIVDDFLPADQLVKLAPALSSCGVNTLHVRNKQMPAQQLYHLTLKLKHALQNETLKPIINDRIDVAIAAGLDAVHLAGHSVPVDAARRMLGKSFTIGRSVHHLDEALAAEEDGASYLTYGHIFESQSKPGLSPRGLQALLQIVDRVSIPVIAIGGIKVDNVHDVLNTGVSGIAVIGAVIHQDNPAEAAQLLRTQIDLSSSEPKHPLHL